MLPLLVKLLTLLDLNSPQSTLYLHLQTYLNNHPSNTVIVLSLLAIILKDRNLQQPAFVYFQKQLEQQYSSHYLQILACITAEGGVSVNRVLAICNMIEMAIQNANDYPDHSDKHIIDNGEQKVKILKYDYFVSAVMEYVQKSGENQHLLPFLQSMSIINDNDDDDENDD